MKKIMFLLLFLPATLSAQTTTTTIATLGGVVNCQSIALTVTRVQNGEIKTTIDFSIRECENGGTVPTKSTAFYYSPITNTDFTTDRTGAHLITNSPYGPIKIDWIITKDSHSSYDATWTWYTPNQARQTQNDDNQSAHAIGNIGSYSVDRNGYFTTSVFKK